MLVRRLWRVVLNLVISLVSLTAGVALVEIATGLMESPFHGPESSAEVCDPLLGWRGRPNYETAVQTEGLANALKLNRAGHHDTDRPLEKAPGTTRILVLGDSFARAHQVAEKETAHQVLQDWLDAQGGAGRYEVINAGVDAWGTGQELLYYREEGRLYRPDVVLLWMYLGNDVKDNLPGRGLTLGDRNCYSPYFVLCAGDGLDPHPWRHAPGLAPSMGTCSEGRRRLAAALAWLHDRSNLYRLLEPLLMAEIPEVSALSFYEKDNPTFDYGLALTLALVEQMRAEVEADGARFGVVLISPEDLIEFLGMSDEEKQAVVARLPVMRAAEAMPPPDEMVAARLEERGVAVLDLVAAFAEETERSGESLYFAGDRHWNRAGNRLAGETIGRWLEAKDLLEW